MAGQRQSTRYSGPERRRHRLYVTRNTEYHFRDSVCIAVRDRRTGSWLPAHLALNRTLSGGVRIASNGVPIPIEEEPNVGDALFFGAGGRELITSSLCEVSRPAKTLIAKYPEATHITRAAS